jgi:small-conductance mechanosensitive channel
MSRHPFCLTGPRIWLAAALMALALAAQAQGPDGSTEDVDLLQWSFRLDLVEAALAKQQVDDALASVLRPTADEIDKAARALREISETRAGEIRGLLEALGPAPADGEPPEETAVAEKRQLLQEQLARQESRLKQSDLVAARAGQFLTKLSERVRAQLAERILSRGPSPLSWAVLERAPGHVRYALGQLAEAPLAAWAPAVAARTSPLPGWLLLLMLAVALLVVVPLRLWLLRRMRRDHAVLEPSFSRRVLTAISIAIGRGLLPALVTGLPLAVVLTGVPERGIAADMVVAALIGATAVILVRGISRAALAPVSTAAWRIAPLTDESALGLHQRIVQLSLVIAMLVFIEYPAERHLEIPEALALFYDFVADTVVAAAILALLPSGLWHLRPPPGETASAGRKAAGTVVRGVVALAALAIPVFSVLGYGTLAGYLAKNLVLTGALLGLLVVLHGLARDLTSLVLRRIASGEEQAPAATSSGDDGGTAMLHFWLVAAVDLTLASGGILALLTVWGVGWLDLRELIRALVGGVSIGSFTLSLTDLLAAIAVFAAILVTTRALQRLLEQRVFPRTRLDAGVRHSLKTALGYAGLVLAALLAISALGLDLSNIALIAGALSVGVGFGLQNIVNNFVSGLILLVERPIKVGDWVVVGGHQGYVKRINVRATEIQTFQRSSVIIPNSELVSNAVVNWTHKDTFARVDIPVGVAYGSDTQRVREVLLECARGHPKTNRWPEPNVLFMDFGASSLDFELRLFIGKADETFVVASELRYAIDLAFREAGVEIPFPQRDLHLRDLDRLEAALRRDPPGPGNASPPGPIAT